jgi:hypothetical protein
VLVGVLDGKQKQLAFYGTFIKTIVLAFLHAPSMFSLNIDNSLILKTIIG